MPVCERAIPDPIKDPENKPWSTGKKQDNKIGPPEWLDDPSKKIEQDQDGMKYDKKNIGHASLIQGDPSKKTWLKLTTTWL